MAFIGNPEILPVVISTDDVEPMVVLVVALTRSRVERPLVVALPVDKVLSGRETNRWVVRCQSWHLYGTGPPSGCDVHG